MGSFPLQIFALKAKKQNGENMERKSRHGAPLIPQLNPLALTPADCSGQCQTFSQHLELGLHSWFTTYSSNFLSHWG